MLVLTNDMILIIRQIARGWRYSEKDGVMVFSWEVWRSDEKMTGEKRTALVMAAIANSLEKNIQSQQTIQMPIVTPECQSLT